MKMFGTVFLFLVLLCSPAFAVQEILGLSVVGPFETIEECTVSISVGFGTGPRSLTLNTLDGHIYGTNSVASVIFDIDPVTNTFIRTSGAGLISPLAELRGIAYAPNTNKLYAAERQNNNVRVLNGTTLADITGIAIAGGPDGVEFISSTGEIFVTNRGTNRIHVINTTTDSSVATIVTGALPVGMVHASLTDRVYVVNFNGDSVTVINPGARTVVATITLPVGAQPQAAAYDSFNEQVYILNNGPGTISVVDPATNSIIGTMLIPFPGNIDVIYNPNLDRVYSTSSFLFVHNAVSFAFIAFTDALMADAQGMVFVPAVNRVYVAEFGAATVCSMSF